MHKLSTYALEQSDKLYVKTMLELAHRLYDTDWEYQEFQSNVVLVDLESTDGQTFWKERPSGTLMIAYARENTVQAEHFVQKPVRVSPFVETLKHLSAKLNGGEATATLAARPVVKASTPEPAPAKTPPESTPPFSGLEDPLYYPDRYLSGLLRQAKEAGNPTHYVIAGIEHLYYDPVKNLCYCSFPRFNQIASSKKLLYCSPAKQVTQEAISPEALAEKAQAPQFTAHPLDSMLWFLGLCASQGRLIEGHPRTAPVRLKQFPNFALLPHEPLHMKMAAFMLKNTVSLKTVADQTGIGLSRVVDFFNACYLIGLIHAEAETADEKMRKRSNNPADRQNLFKNILNRLIK